MKGFDHERLDVYRVAIRMNVALNKALAKVGRRGADIAAQARRAGISVPLNIAEASGEFSELEKIRFFRIARRSATEVAAALDILEALEFLTAEDLVTTREYLNRVVAMLTVLTRPNRAERATRLARDRQPPAKHPRNHPDRQRGPANPREP